MDEHDDDLESTVHEGAEIETDTFPDTAEEFDAEPPGDDDEEFDPDVDKAEL
jgi:hypothetical protein